MPESVEHNSKPVCSAKGANGLACARPAMSGASYCYRHTFLRLNGVPFYKNLTIHLLVSSVAFLSLFYYLSRHWNEDWLAMMYDMNRGAAAVERLSIYLEQEERQTGTDLSETYPYGYALFAVDVDGNHVHRQVLLGDAFGIDWDRFRVVQMATNVIYVVPPTVFFGDAICSMTGTAVAVSRPNPTSVLLCCFEKIRLYLAIVRDRGDAVVLVLGFT